MPKFSLRLHGPSNNASSQNTAAQQQIQQAYEQAMKSFMQWQQANPFPLNNIAPPKAGPQFGTQAPGQDFGGMHGALSNTLAQNGGGKKKKAGSDV